jgi:hypothetical protein
MAVVFRAASDLSMTGSTEKIDALLRRLEESGAEPQRLDVLRRTQRFKRSWVELAESLVEVRKSKSYERWGHTDFHEYCAAELHLRRATVDKLTISFSTLQRLAPQVLTWDGIERQVPSYQAVDYLARAADKIGDRAAANDAGKGPGREELKELRHAVFDEGQSVAELRRRFDPIFHPKPKGAETLTLYDRTDAAARKLVESLADLPGLSERRVAAVEKAIAGLREELQELAEPLREKVDRAKKRAREAAKA